MPNTQYEERLGTDRMLPLVFRMALPAVAAQLVNLLYTLVDVSISATSPASVPMRWQGWV